MVKTIKKAIFSFLLIASCNTFGENAPQEAATHHGVGAGGTVFETWGFLYRYNNENRFGFSSTLLPVLYGSDYFTAYIGNSLGLSYSLNAHKFPKSKLEDSSIKIYLVGYLANIYSYNTRYLYADKKQAIDTRSTLKTGIGIGPGAEFYFNKNIALHLEIPWMTFFKSDFLSKKITFDHSYPHIGGGIAYYF